MAVAGWQCIERTRKGGEWQWRCGTCVWSLHTHRDGSCPVFLSQSNNHVSVTRNASPQPVLLGILVLQEVKDRKTRRTERIDKTTLSSTIINLGACWVFSIFLPARFRLHYVNNIFYCIVKVDRTGVMDGGRGKVEGERGMSSGENRAVL